MTTERRMMYVPTIGDEVTLACDWTFGLYNEYRNEAMIQFIFPGTKMVSGGSSWGIRTLLSGEKVGYGKKIADVELPAGAVLKVDRIYIRKGKGMKEFDSITFILQSIPRKEISIPEKRDIYVKGEHGYNDGKYVSKNFIKKKARFWAKLHDINKMEFFIGREELEDEKPAVGRLIRVAPREELGNE